MNVVIIQSNYIPWKGYFDLIHDADVFVFHDDLQYTKGDWRNRNKIKTPNGSAWLSIPVGTSEHRLICDVRLEDPDWAKKHWRQIQQHYSRATFFEQYSGLFETVYLRSDWSSLSELNQHLIKAIAVGILGIPAQFRDSREFGLTSKKQERVIELVERVGGDTYISGPAAKSYIEEGAFRDRGIEVKWKSYDGYPEYDQFYPPFDHFVSVLDLIFHTGPRAAWHIWGWREEAPGPVTGRHP